MKAGKENSRGDKLTVKEKWNSRGDELTVAPSQAPTNNPNTASMSTHLEHKKGKQTRMSTHHHSAQVTSHLVKARGTKLAGKEKSSRELTPGKEIGNLVPQVRPAPALTTPASSPNLSHTF